MLLGYEGHFEATVIRDLVAVLRAHGDGPEFHVPSEHLVEVATKAVSLSAGLYRGVELEWPQLLDDEVHVVVEVTTHDYRSIRILPHDISDDIGDSLRSLTEVLLFTWLKVAVQNLDIGAAHLYLGPAQRRPKCLYQLQPGVGS